MQFHYWWWREILCIPIINLTWISTTRTIIHNQHPNPPLTHCPPLEYGCNLKWMIFLRTDILSIYSEIAFKWMSQNLTDDNLTLVQVMAWCRQATNLYLSRCRHLGAVSIRKTVLLGMAIPMLKIRRPTGRLIFNMGIPIPGKTVFYIETRPWPQWVESNRVLLRCNSTRKASTRTRVSTETHIYVFIKVCRERRHKPLDVECLLGVDIIKCISPYVFH